MSIYGGDKRHLLFNDGRLSDLFAFQKRKALSEADRHDESALVRTDIDNLVSHFFNRYELTLPTIHDKDDEITGETKETKADTRALGVPMFDRFDRPTVVAATLFTFRVSFEGDAELFKYQGNTFGPSKPAADVGDSELTFQYAFQSPEPDTVTATLKKDIEQTKFWLRDIGPLVAAFNSELKAKLAEAIGARKQRLATARAAVRGLPFKMNLRDGVPKTYAAPEVRRKVALESPVLKKGDDPEPVLLESDYEHILSVCSNMARVLELSPKAFVDMKEETLRSHFLVQLNGHYLGDATGETFNCEGKTDVMVKSKGKNIFIGECKFWGGEKLLAETIDQLLGYASWRDTKTAILLFNRNKDFSAVLKKIPPIVAQHGNFLRHVDTYKHESAFRFVMHHKNDAEKELTLTISAFEVPT